MSGRRILIDGTMARGGGGLTYLVNILPRLVGFASQDRFRVLLRSEPIAASLAPAPNLEVEVMPEVGLGGRLRFNYRELPRKLHEWGADLYFSAGESAPLSAPCPIIASFRNPNAFTSLDQGWPLYQKLRLGALRHVARLSAGVADRVMFVSADSASWIGDRIGIEPRKRSVIHHGIDAEAWAAGTREPVHPWPYILSVSSIYRYKNFVRLIEAYSELAKRCNDVPDLLIIGDDQDPAYSRKMEEARRATGALSEHIYILGEVPYAQIRNYYAGAELFVFPSYLETFGHPLLEAMAAEVPVVASDIPVFREIAGDGAFYADPHSAESLASAMDAALFRPEARELLVKRSRERVRHFSWDRTAHELLALFTELLEERAQQEAPAPAPGWRAPARAVARQGLRAA